MKEGTTPGEDVVVPEVIHRINIDDSILKYANKLLVDGEKPDQLSILNPVPMP